MQKKWLLSIFVSLIICAILLAIYYRLSPKNQPELKIEFNNSPPWAIRPGKALTLNITIKNEGEASAKNVCLNFTMAAGFKISQSGTNHFNKKFSEIKPGEIKTLTLTITLAIALQPGDYPFTLTVYAENASPLTLNDKITVELPT